ncbi:MAG: acyl-CoA dehydrogenase family protein [Candidatus Omnitrophica bacterium]|nr:acyl-CoA dehydrogenase family protein [Candidatus Omnitrophota bacterium]
MPLDISQLHKLSEGKRQALEVAEEARETVWQHPSFVSQLFLGRLRSDWLLPYPQQGAEDRRIGDAFLATLEAFLKAKVDPDAIDRTGEMPPEVIRGLAELGCFGMKIPTEYGGLGLSQVNYNRAIELIGSYCGSTTVWLSAHQSIGVPQPLKLFGTPEQKHAYLPRVAKGEISAFALTEPDVGSDPAKMKTTATPVDHGEAYLISGEKLWCTNGPAAQVLVVMAQTPPKMIDGREKKQITAFIVERSMPGVETVHRCQFMGLRGISNGLLRFTNVRVPKENIIAGLGRGLKVALATLNTGRLTLPAGCVGMSKRCLEICRQWAKQRVQWGAPIGEHEVNAAKLSWIACHTFAMEAVTFLTSALVDRGGADVRLEAAMAKLFASEQSWRVIDETMQIRGGRGYETADSLRARGEPGIPIERIMRDARINLIIEGTSEIMHLFIAREALDPHMHLAGEVLNPKAPPLRRLAAAVKAAGFYSLWYLRQWLTWSGWPKHAALDGALARQLRYVEHTAHRLARTLFHQMLWYQQRLERRQLALFRLVNIGMDLFAISATIARAAALLDEQTTPEGTRRLAVQFCQQARLRIAEQFRALGANEDRFAYRIGRDVLAAKYAWLEDGIVDVEY